MSDYTVVARLAGTGETRLESRVIIELPPEDPWTPPGPGPTPIQEGPLAVWSGQGDYAAWEGRSLVTGALVPKRTGWLKGIAEFDYCGAARERYPAECDAADWNFTGPVPPAGTPVPYHLEACYPSAAPAGHVALVGAAGFCFVFFHPAGSDGVLPPFVVPGRVVRENGVCMGFSVGRGFAYLGTEAYYHGEAWHDAHLCKLRLPDVSRGAVVLRDRQTCPLGILGGALTPSDGGALLDVSPFDGVVGGFPSSMARLMDKASAPGGQYDGTNRWIEERLGTSLSKELDVMTLYAWGLVRASEDVLVEMTHRQVSRVRFVQSVEVYETPYTPPAPPGPEDPPEAWEEECLYLYPGQSARWGVADRRSFPYPTPSGKIWLLVVRIGAEPGGPPQEIGEWCLWDRSMAPAKPCG